MLFTLFTFVAMTKYHLRKKEYVLFAYAPKGESLMVREAWKSLLKAERSHFVAGNWVNKLKAGQIYKLTMLLQWNPTP